MSAMLRLKLNRMRFGYDLEKLLGEAACGEILPCYSALSLVYYIARTLPGVLVHEVTVLSSIHLHFR